MSHAEPAAPTGFSSLLASLVPDDDRFTVTLPADWLQGRTAYGGLSAALCLQATLRAFPGLPPLRSAQFAFVGPATGALCIAPRMLRQGKSAAFAGVDLEGDSGPAVRATLCFGAGRDLPHDHGKYTMPGTPPRESCPAFYAWDNRPNFMSHFDGRLAGGSLPMSGGPSPQMLVWLRHRDSSVSADLVSLVALADALPPASFASFAQGGPVGAISTMTWSIDMLDAAVDNPAGWWLLHAEAETIRDGYSAQTTVVWHPDGRAVMVARQTVAIFGKRPATDPAPRS